MMKKAQMMMVLSWGDLFKGLIIGLIIGFVVAWLAAAGIISFPIALCPVQVA